MAVKGIWYEESRRRWRVKLFLDRTLIHRSYHRSYEEALAAWQEEKRKISESQRKPVHKATLFNRWACRPLIGAD